LEGPTCSQTSEGGLRADASSSNTGGAMESKGDGGGVEAPLKEDEELLAKERECLMPLFSSITHK
jgi:hypothetical protein